jgi:AcrR family transcriptional regulator
VVSIGINDKKGYIVRPCNVHSELEVDLEKERKQLMEAAREVFAELGLRGASLESIAERAQLSPPVARALFIDKERLFQAVLQEATGPVVDAIGMAVENVKDPKELIRRSLRHLDQWALENEAYIRILQWCTLEGAKSIEKMYEQSFFPSEFYEKLTQYIESGALRVRDPFMVSLLLDSLIFFSHMMRPSLELISEESAEQLFERRIDAVMDVLENGLYRA